MLRNENLDFIKFGNPLFDQTLLLSDLFYLDTEYEFLTSFWFPKNSSKETKKELNEISSITRSISNDSKKINYLLDIYANIEDFCNQSLSYLGVKIDEEESKELFDDVFRFVVKLKYVYNRPRPYQLAAYYNLSLFPFSTQNVDTPSYPSFRWVYFSVLKNVYLKNYLETGYIGNPFSSIRESLISLGLNYQSDLEFSEKVSDSILNNKGFIKKYCL